MTEPKLCVDILTALQGLPSETFPLNPSHPLTLTVRPKALLPTLTLRRVGNLLQQFADVGSQIRHVAHVAADVSRRFAAQGARGADEEMAPIPEHGGAEQGSDDAMLTPAAKGHKTQARIPATRTTVACFTAAAAILREVSDGMAVAAHQFL